MKHYYSFKVVLGTIFVLISMVSLTNADCGVCSAVSSAACTSKYNYKICPTADNKPAETLYTCPEGQICTDTQGICKPEAAGTTAGCPSTGTNTCNTCAGNFACVTQTRYAMCDSTGKVLNITGECADKKVCSTAFFTTAKSICGTICETTATCSNVSPVTTTTVAPATPDYAAVCDAVSSDGNYPLKNNDPCARKYVLCESDNGKMYAVLLSCGNDQYFDPTKRVCVSEKPSGC